MRVDYASRLLLKTTPIDLTKTKCLSNALLLANNFIAPTGKGLYAFLPLGQRVLDKLTRLVEDELRAIGAQKCSLPAIGSEELWTRSGRWDLYGSALFRFRDRWQRNMCLQPTCEEMITEIMAQYGDVRRDSFPVILTQTTEKYRDEMNPRFGLLRGRQFIMNDTYSFDRNEHDAQRTYESVSDAYRRIFYERLQLDDVRVVAAETGEMGGNVSHEYHLANNSAEDRIVTCTACTHTTVYAPTASAESTNADAPDDAAPTCSTCGAPTCVVQSIEAAHTFRLGQRYAAAFNATRDGKIPYSMCCFGIGITRVIAAAVDACTVSTTAMRLPEAISPYKLAVVLPKVGNTHHAMRFSRDLVEQLTSVPSLRDELLVDDRANKSIGRRLAELNQIGIPRLLVVPARKSRALHEPIEMEYYKALPRSDKFDFVGTLNHSNIFSVLSAELL